MPPLQNSANASGLPKSGMPPTSAPDSPTTTTPSRTDCMMKTPTPLSETMLSRTIWLRSSIHSPPKLA